MKRYCKKNNMRKMIIQLSAIMLILLPSVVFAQEPIARTLKGYFVVGGGGGGDSESSNMRIEGGAYTTIQAVNILFGLGMPFTLNRDDTPSSLHDYPCPHNNFTDLGNRKKGEEVGMYGKFGIEPIKNTGFFIFGTGGFTLGKEIQLTQSNITRLYYTESETTKTYGLFGGGIGYFPMQGHFTAQVQYDNRMGVTGNLGFAW
jgi:hypothetical protein